MEMKLLKKVKFAMLLSLVTVVGIQAGEAKRVYCPHVADIRPPTHGADGYYSYYAKSTFNFTGTTMGPVTLKSPQVPLAHSDYYGTKIHCGYDGLGESKGLLLSTDEVPAKQKCKAQSDKGYFDCS